MHKRLFQSIRWKEHRQQIETTIASHFQLFNFSTLRLGVMTSVRARRFPYALPML
jgi:hypothetical protein